MLRVPTAKTKSPLRDVRQRAWTSNRALRLLSVTLRRHTRGVMMMVAVMVTVRRSHDVLNVKTVCALRQSNSISLSKLDRQFGESMLPHLFFPSPDITDVGHDLSHLAIVVWVGCQGGFVPHSLIDSAIVRNAEKRLQKANSSFSFHSVLVVLWFCGSAEMRSELVHFPAAG
jgi:hypothetical protein